MVCIKWLTTNLRDLRRKSYPKNKFFCSNYSKHYMEWTHFLDVSCLILYIYFKDHIYINILSLLWHLHYFYQSPILSSKHTILITLNTSLIFTLSRLYDTLKYRSNLPFSWIYKKVTKLYRQFFFIIFKNPTLFYLHLIFVL